MAICKTVIRGVVITGVVAGLAAGAVAVTAGPQALFAIVGQARDKVAHTIELAIDDPVALRAQLRELESAYPERIGEVRGELTELQQQIAQLQQDGLVAQKVVEMASADLASLKDMLARAESARTGAPYTVINVRFGGQALSLEQAYSRATQISNTIAAYQTRVSDAERDVTFLQQQADRLNELLAQLETEQAELQAQIWQLDGQIEMIARNDKLIDMVERRQNAIEKYDKFEAVSLEQVKSRIAKIRSTQEARLNALAANRGTDYETKARTTLDSERAAKQIFERAQQLSQPKPETVEITPSGATQPAQDDGSKSVASVERIVID